MTILLIYLALQIVNVILATIKSIVTVRGTKLAAAIMNALSYSVNIVVVIYSVADFNLLAKIAITAGTNFAGTYLGIYLLERLRKDKIWQISGTVNTAKAYISMKDALKSHPEIDYCSLTLDDNKGYIFYIYTKNKDQSRIVRNILEENSANVIVNEQNIEI